MLIIISCVYKLHKKTSLRSVIGYTLQGFKPDTQYNNQMVA